MQNRKVSPINVSGIDYSHFITSNRKPDGKTIEQLCAERDDLNRQIYLEEMRIFAKSSRERRALAFLRKNHPDIDDVTFANDEITRAVFNGVIATVFRGHMSLQFAFQPAFTITFRQDLPEKVTTTIILHQDSEDAYQSFVSRHWELRGYAIKWFECVPLLEAYGASLDKDDVFWTIREMFYLTIGRMTHLPKDVRRLIWTYLSEKK